MSPAKAPPDFLLFLADQLAGLPDFTWKRMFGGYGLYAGGVFFGIVADGRFYFKTSTVTRKSYLDEGMAPFRPTEKQTLKNYYEVPVRIIEDADALLAWAGTSVQQSCA
ncbi:MAG: TfoX/Sxy family protein [Candidatus Melainabacteria bacterium]